MQPRSLCKHLETERFLCKDKTGIYTCLILKKITYIVLPHIQNNTTMKLTTTLFAWAVSATITYAQCTSLGNSVPTSYSSNTGASGVMFDITALNTITVLCFDANLYGGTTDNYQIYYKAGTYVGSQSNAAAWTLAGTASSLHVSSNNVATSIPVSVNVVIPTGQTYAFYITGTSSGGVNYTSSVIPGVTLASDLNMLITGGVGKSYPFGSTFSYRLFSGTLHYALGDVLPVELLNFKATFTEQQRVHLNWQTETENNSDHFTLERSADALNWEKITAVPAAGMSQHLISYDYYDENPLEGLSYYRLSETDNNGKRTYFDVVSLESSSVTASEQLIVFPNPATGKVTVYGMEKETEQLSVTDLMGRTLLSSDMFIPSGNTISIDISGLDSQVFIVRAGNRSTLVFKH